MSRKPEELIRHYGPHGWHTMTVVKRGRKWIVCRELFRRMDKNGKMVYRKKKVKLEDCDAALWE